MKCQFVSNVYPFFMVGHNMYEDWLNQVCDIQLERCVK